MENKNQRTVKELCDDIASGVNDPIANEMRDCMKNNNDRGKQKCRLCDTEYTPDTWNFYGLCNGCFPQFDKYRISEGAQGNYVISANEWIKGMRQNAKA